MANTTCAVTVGFGWPASAEDKLRWEIEAAEARRAYPTAAFKMTVGDLRKALERYPDSMPVGVWDCESSEAYEAETALTVDANFNDRDGRRLIGKILVIK